MPKLVFTAAEINAYLKATPNIPVYFNHRYSIDPQNLDRRIFDPLHPYYVDSLFIAEDMKVHADGFYPYKLIDERRPHETLEVKEYRRRIWVSKTKPTFTKVLNSLQKIRRSADWVMKFSDSWNSDFPRVPQGEDLETYCTKKFPYFTSITDWAFSFLLRKYLIDPNAVCFIDPLERDIEQTALLQPIPIIFDSVNVMDFVDEDYAVLLNPYGAVFYDGHGRQHLGKSVFIITTQQVLRYDQKNLKMDFDLTEYNHGLGELPAFKLGGTLIDQTDNYFLFESRISGMIPELNEAVREYSDLQAAKVLHIYPERWEFTNTECPTCLGTGRNIENEKLLCHDCHGLGHYVNPGPYAKTIITPNKTTDGNSGNVPNPPIGYVAKDMEIVKLQNEGVQQHLADALAAINFEFLINVPLTQSGVAKQYDRNESNNTSHAVAEDIVGIMDKMVNLITKYRYGTLYPNQEDLEKMLPTIPVPENYDLYSISDSQDELNKAKEGKTNPAILNALEVDFASKRFNSDQDVKDLVMLILQLDPMPNITEDEKMSRLANKGITQEAYTISCNIQEFVQRAIDEDEKFTDKKLKEQKAQMSTYAQEVIKTAAAATAKLIPMNGPGSSGLGPNGQPLPAPPGNPRASQSPNNPINQNLPLPSSATGN